MKATKYFAALVMAIIVASPTLCSAADYFFGGDTTGTDYYAWSDSSYVVDSMTSPANTGNLDSGIIWLNNLGTTPDTASIIIYNIDSTFLDSTASFVVGGAAARTRYSAAFIGNASISASTKYFVGFHCASEGTGGTLRVYANVAVTVSNWYKLTQPVIPATITAPTKDTNAKIKAWGVYFSDAAATTVKKPQNAHLGNVKL